MANGEGRDGNLWAAGSPVRTALLRLTVKTGWEGGGRVCGRSVGERKIRASLWGRMDLERDEGRWNGECKWGCCGWQWAGEEERWVAAVFGSLVLGEKTKEEGGQRLRLREMKNCYSVPLSSFVFTPLPPPNFSPPPCLKIFFPR